MAVYDLGDIVVISHEEKSCVGVVVGVLEAANGPFFDVSLEDVVLKALPLVEVKAARADEVRALLVGLVRGAQQAMSARQAILRTWYIESLTTGLGRLENTSAVAPLEDPTFKIGATVAIREQQRWMLGVVRGMSQGSSGVLYDVESMGDMVRVGQQVLTDIKSADFGGSLLLGQRARMVASGHESDDAYAGTICAIEKQGDRWLYSLMFDDGDILEELAAEDLTG